MDVLYMVTIPMSTGLTKDYCVNTYTFRIDSDDGAIHSAIHADFKVLYDALSSMYATPVAQNGWMVKAYNWDAPKPRAPIFELPFNLAADPTQNELPAEVAVCVSFQGTRASGVAQARRRGRVYIGPLGATVNSQGRVNSANVTQLKNAFTTFLNASTVAANRDWMVYSRVQPVGQRTTPVIGGWVDNAFDIQRRRGLASSARTLWP